MHEQTHVFSLRWLGTIAKDSHSAPQASNTLTQTHTCTLPPPFRTILLASLHPACLHCGCEPEPGRGHFTRSKPCWRLQWIPAIPPLCLLHKRCFCRKRARKRLKCVVEWLVVGPSCFFISFPATWSLLTSRHLACISQHAFLLLSLVAGTMCPMITCSTFKAQAHLLKLLLLWLKSNKTGWRNCKTLFVFLSLKPWRLLKH